MIVLVVLFWASLAALAWTHVLYPLVAIGLSRVVPRPVHEGDVEPTVAVIVAAYNEEAVIARRLENLLELDYPRDRLQIVVSSDASEDRTEAVALEFGGVTVISNPRGGKVAYAQTSCAITSTGSPAAIHASRPPSSGRTRTNPALIRSFATCAAEASFGQLQ